MAISLTRFPWSMWGGRGKEKEPVSKKPSALNSSLFSERGFAKETKRAPPHRKVGRNREERRVDSEYDDIVLVPSDDDWCLSGSESDDSDWSIGWSEPLGSDFQNNDDDDGGDDGFAVLVQCYKPSCKEVQASNKAILGVIKNLSKEFSPAGKNYMEQWLASLQDFQG